MNTIFQPWAFSVETNIAVDAIETAMPHHINRWNSPQSMGSWLNSINAMVTHNQNRVNTSRDHLMQSFNLPNDYECTLDAVPVMAGLVRINTITPGPLPWDGIYFENVPVEIEAVAQPGYLFEKWETNQHIASGDMEQFTKMNTVPLFTDDLYQAHFIPCPEDASATVEAGDTGLSVTTSNVPYADSIAWQLDGVTVGMGTGWWPEFSGNYSATVFFDGCSVTAGETYVEGLGTMAVEAVEASRPTIYPNPAHERAFIQVLPGATVHAFSAHGELIQTTTAGADGVATLDLRNWPEGIYIVHSGPIREKLIVQRGG